jgi:hypothetical protein
MYDEGSLAKTGVFGGLTFLGVTVTVDWLIALVVTLIVVGAFTYRYATRGRRG